MPDKKSILLVTTQYRAGERIYPIIPHLSKKYNIDLVKLYQMHPNHIWKGDKDMRVVFDAKYSSFFNKTYTDIHGNSEHGYNIKNINICYDACFVFGQKEVLHNFQIPGGIPSNDNLKNYVNIPKEHILIIIAHLGNYGKAAIGNGDYFKLFNKEFFEKINLLKIQQHYNKPVVLKLKSRDDGPPLQQNIEYLHNILPQGLDYKIIVDVEDDNLLVAQSIVTIGAPSAMSFKPIQLGIPTALLKGYGQTGKFADYLGLVEDNYDEVMQALSLSKQNNFIQETIQGGLTWNSTEYFLDYIKQLLNA